MPSATTYSKVKNISREALKIFIFTFIIVYFGYHLINGQNGIVNYLAKKARLEKLETEMERVEAKRDNISSKVHKLYPRSLDGDLLDEQYRRTTGKIRPDEVIYYYE